MFDNDTTEAQPNRRRALIVVLALFVAAAITAIVMLPSHASHAARGIGTQQSTAGPSSGQPTDAGTAGDPAAPADPSAPGGSTGPAASGGGSTGTSSGGGSGPVTGAGSGGSSHSSSHSSPPAAPHGPGSTPVTPVHITASVTGSGGYYGVCPPFELPYTATITASRPTDVTYQWLGTSTSGTHTVHVSGSVTLTSNLDVYRSGSGTVAIQVLTPALVTSNSAYYNNACTGVTIGTATPSANAYTGDCTHGHVVRTTVTLSLVNPPTGGTLNVHYHWLFNDGGVANETVSFPEPYASQTVSYDRIYYNHGATAPATQWAQLVLDGPFSGSSNQASYSIWCV